MNVSDGNGRELRIGDTEREQAARQLGEHYAAGRLTKEEYDERSDAAFAARTAADLRPLFTDLPALHGQPAARTGPVSGPVASPVASPVTGPRAPTRRRHSPMLAVLLVLLLVAIALTRAWWLVFVFGWLLLCRPGRRWR